MKATVLRAASFRSLGPRLFDSVILAELIEAVKDRYNFRQVPTLAELADKPGTFGYGELKRGDAPIVIEQMIIAYAGIQATSVGASTRTSTEDSDFFLDDIIGWFGEKYRLDTASPFAPAYQSSLEVVFVEAITDRFEKLRPVGQQIAQFVKRYGVQNCPDFVLEGLSMHFEPNPALIPSPVAFSIQRRIGSRYADNKYFSQAPLKTKDHEAVLEQLETILLT